MISTEQLRTFEEAGCCHHRHAFDDQRNRRGRGRHRLPPAFSKKPNRTKHRVFATERPAITTSQPYWT